MNEGRLKTNHECHGSFRCTPTGPLLSPLFSCSQPPFSLSPHIPASRTRIIAHPSGEGRHRVGMFAVVENESELRRGEGQMMGGRFHIVESMLLSSNAIELVALS